MPKKSTRKSSRQPAARGRRLWPTRSAAAALVACVALVGAAAALWAPLGLGPAPPPPPAPAPQQANLALSKEYIYSGGRLVATEEPAAGPPPSNLVATTKSPVRVDLSWTPPASGAVTGYIVERAQSKDGPFTRLTPDPTAASFVDAPPFADAAYLYRVRAVFASGASSDYGNVDIATTFAFADDPLIRVGNPQGLPPTKVKAVHLTDLRRAVDAVRSLVPSMGAGAWKGNPPPAINGSILAAHFKELRDQLNPALAALGIPQLPEDSTLGVGKAVKATHIQDVRDKVK